MEFLNSLKTRSKHYSSPFNHWEINEPLTREEVNEICFKRRLRRDQLERSRKPNEVIKDYESTIFKELDLKLEASNTNLTRKNFLDSKEFPNWD